MFTVGRLKILVSKKTLDKCLENLYTYGNVGRRLFIIILKKADFERKFTFFYFAAYYQKTYYGYKKIFSVNFSRNLSVED